MILVPVEVGGELVEDRVPRPLGYVVVAEELGSRRGVELLTLAAQAALLGLDEQSHEAGADQGVGEGVPVGRRLLGRSSALHPGDGDP